MERSRRWPSVCSWLARARRRRSRSIELSRHRLRLRSAGAGWLPGLVAAPAAEAGKGARVRALIAGGGPAGDAVAAGLRDVGFDGEIVLVGPESEPPYERPHLSKGYLMGGVPREKLGLRPAQQYRELGVELRLGQRVIDLGIEQRAAELESGEAVSWDILCIATGSSARRLPGFEDGLYLRELADAEAL